MRRKIYLFIVVVLILSLLSMPSAVAGEITGVSTPPSDLGFVFPGSEVTLEFNATFSNATQSMAIILVNFSDVGFTFNGFTATMNGVNVSNQFDVFGTTELMVNCSSITPANGSLSVDLRFGADAALGNYTFSWRHIYAAFQRPPDPPTTVDARGTAQVEVVISVKIPLYTGWNLMGIPLRPRNSSVEGVFQGNLSKVDAIYGFSNQWKNYTYWISGLQNQTLQEIEGGKGYWVKASQDFTVTLLGTQTDRSPMYLGWNLIGINGTASTALGDFFAPDLSQLMYVYGFDNQAKDYSHWIKGLAPQYQTLKTLHPGRGYWVKLES